MFVRDFFQSVERDCNSRGIHAVLNMKTPKKLPGWLLGLIAIMFAVFFPFMCFWLTRAISEWVAIK